MIRVSVAFYCCTANEIDVMVSSFRTESVKEYFVNKVLFSCVVIFSPCEFSYKVTIYLYTELY